ncbi:conserved protein of unknown function [Candidatus Filomicrobium marinum]|uniref:DUF86 domain-containing protein n=1 Tax=Candidatus Filomicrobium marinum TaxID=1608628 RepID=A0A0D6JBA7_9HYPH|nr:MULTISPECIES: HepT-like ribonuclease domain-containing protein [Filomicrobium]MCV0370978.1 DUF86 domain-containing protein [Filomicrobium sp.]CFX04314.1 conserved protein of unknown function [Candidatus Filomicrobium marinum]CPR16023.1 conserved protein of unknown function [Candidatus Filomicrobium marinum]
MARSVDHLLKDILEEIAFIKKATSKLTLNSYAADDLTRRAVERAILTISEAVRGIPAKDLNSQPSIPWVEIKGIGNILRHEYHKVANEVIWDTLKKDFPPLGKAIRAIIKAKKSEKLKAPRKPANRATSTKRKPKAKK